MCALSKEAELPDRVAGNNASDDDKPPSPLDEMQSTVGPQVPKRLRQGTQLLKLLMPDAEDRPKDMETTRKFLRIATFMDTDLRKLTKDEELKVSKEDVTGEYFNIGTLILGAQGKFLTINDRARVKAIAKKNPNMKFDEEFLESIEYNCTLILDAIDEVRKHKMVLPKPEPEKK
jgi:hypothetical protein